MAALCVPGLINDRTARRMEWATVDAHIDAMRMDHDFVAWMPDQTPTKTSR